MGHEPRQTDPVKAAPLDYAVAVSFEQLIVGAAKVRRFVPYSRGNSKSRPLRLYSDEVAWSERLGRFDTDGPKEIIRGSVPEIVNS